MKDEYDFTGAKRGPVILPQGKTRLTIYMDDGLFSELENKSSLAGHGIQETIHQAVQEYLHRSNEPIESTLRRVLREELQLQHVGG
ncbi:MAG: CopG family transcriptional regulator [Magnetococcales bacterium]|nr:CopG family transcriptional regulator [Magnetococcales bacterium]